MNKNCYCPYCGTELRIMHEFYMEDNNETSIIGHCEIDGYDATWKYNRITQQKSDFERYFFG